MKTAMQELINELKESSNIGSNPFITTTINLVIDMAESKLEIEKQQHEKIAIDMVNICLDNLNNENCKMEDEFNKYYKETFEHQ